MTNNVDNNGLVEAEVVIIGAGPVGLFAVFELGMLGIKAHVVETLDFIGGQCQALYPEKPIFDIPAYPEISGGDLIDKLARQAEPFAPEYHLGQQVIALTEQPDGSYILKTSKGLQISTKAIIIAGGCGSFGPNRPPLNDLEAFEATKSVRYMVAQRQEVAGKNIVIAGGGDSAVDWAVNLAGVAKHISVIHRRPKFKAAPETCKQMEMLAEEGKIEIVTPYQLHSLEGRSGVLEKVNVATLDGEIKSLPADILYAFFGLAMELGPIADWQLSLHLHTINVEPTTMQTSRAGIYAIGDICHYTNKLKLILSGFAEAATASHAIYKYLYHVTPKFEYSTSKGVKA